MDIIEQVKKIFGQEEELIEGNPETYDRVKALDDKTLKRRFLGKPPQDVIREVQEELFIRFVSPHSLFNCKDCFGRGHTGWNPAIHALTPCQCLQRVIRTEVGKENQGYLYDPSGNKITFMN